MTRIRAVLLGAIALLTLATLVVPAASAAADDGPLSADGRWFRDPDGRIVILHGLFGVWKNPPYYPTADPAETDPDSRFNATDADLTQEMGLNAMRLAWWWQNLEPTQGDYDEDYLQHVDATQSLLADRGVYTVLDSHQDLYSTRFGSPGLPDWTADPALALNVDNGFPLNYYDSGTSQAFGHLYENREVNGEPLWDAFGDAWKEVVRYFDDDPMIAGYDLMNEPWPGLSEPNSTNGGYYVTDCISSSCLDWDREVLQPFEDSLASSIREVDDERPVFYSPNFWFVQTHENGYEAPPEDVRPAGLAFHTQCYTRGLYQVDPDPKWIEEGHSACPPLEAQNLAYAEQAASRLGGPPLQTEVAPTTNSDYEGLNCLLERNDLWQMGWTYGLSWRSGEQGDLDPTKKQVIARAFPQAIAGRPLDYSFDVRTGEFRLSYLAERGIAAPTRIAVPDVQYPDGYVVEVEGGGVASRSGAPLLEIENRRGAMVVTVEVTPAAGDDTVRPDLPECSLDPDGLHEPATAPAAALELAKAEQHVSHRRKLGIGLRCRALINCAGRLRIVSEDGLKTYLERRIKVGPESRKRVRATLNRSGARRMRRAGKRTVEVEVVVERYGQEPESLGPLTLRRAGSTQHG